MAELYVPLQAGNLRLIPMREEHREPLRAACAEDTEVWAIYPVPYYGDHFDASFEAMMNAGKRRQPYAIFDGDGLVGMTAWIDHNPAFHSVEIGNSYIVPRLRGSGFNDRIKTLMIDHAVALGLRRIVFKVDERNTRSQGAVMKMGGVREGVLRAERITWTGHVRNTVIFSILAEEWTARSRVHQAVTDRI